MSPKNKNKTPDITAAVEALEPVPAAAAAPEPVLEGEKLPSFLTFGMVKTSKGWSVVKCFIEDGELVNQELCGPDPVMSKMAANNAIRVAIAETFLFVVD